MDSPTSELDVGRTSVSGQSELGDTPNETIFRNFYRPSLKFPEEVIGQPSRHRRDLEYTNYLDDENARLLGDLTHVGWKGRVDFALNGYRTDNLRRNAVQYEIHRDPNALLNVSITTIILLASGVYDIPMEYYLYTEMYLLSIRDEYNDSPQNIENLIKHIRYIRQANNIDWTTELNEMPPPGLVISKIPNRSRIPLPVHSAQRSASRDGPSNTDNATK